MKANITYLAGQGSAVEVPQWIHPSGRMNPGQVCNVYGTKTELADFAGTCLVVAEGHADEVDPVADGIERNRQEKLRVAAAAKKTAAKDAEAAASAAAEERSEVARGRVQMMKDKAAAEAAKSAAAAAELTEAAKMTEKKAAAAKKGKK